jgi:GTPase
MDHSETPLPATPDEPDPPRTRAGFVALVGAPNAGKSTLVNRMVGQRLSIVTDRPQTTWRRVTAIRTDDRTQMIFVDTPGILAPSSLVDQALMHETEQALVDADVVLLLVDPTRPLSPERQAHLTDTLSALRSPLVVAVNKLDAADDASLQRMESWAREDTAAELILPVSALTGEGVEELLAALRSRLPESPFLYPPDELSTAPVRFFVAELVRETVFERFRDEIPYASFCQVEEFRKDGKRTYIQVHLFVERSSQKGILIGKGGRAIRDLGSDARERIEHFLGEPVYLDLWVKVLPRWRKKRGQLRRWGFRVPDHDATKSAT